MWNCRSRKKKTWKKVSQKMFPVKRILLKNRILKRIFHFCTPNNRWLKKFPIWPFSSKKAYPFPDRILLGLPPKYLFLVIVLLFIIRFFTHFILDNFYQLPLEKIGILEFFLEIKYFFSKFLLTLFFESSIKILKSF